MSVNEKIAIIGLGYVGLPLAVALAPHHAVTGFDISARRVEELKSGHDRTNEVEDARLQSVKLAITSEPREIEGHTIYIVTVPTPVDKDNRPDLTPVLAACDTLGRVIGKDALVVFESTVYPGVTEKICGPAIENASGGKLKAGVDFFLAYSPERVNPGDKVNTVESVVKIVSASTPAHVERLSAIYGKINGGKIHKAQSIMVAEAAKVVENAQRDINIAFINEVSNILRRMDVSTYDVLAAMNTKWNALNFKPGLVGGHCIGLDPFYLAACARDLGYSPDLIMSGRNVNENMAQMIAQDLHKAIGAPKMARILVLGLTFKEDVPDLRNSKVADLISALVRLGHLISVADPMADADEAYHEYGVALVQDAFSKGPYDIVIGAVAHKAYRELSAADLAKLVSLNGVLADIKGIWRPIKAELPESLTYWQI